MLQIDNLARCIACKACFGGQPRSPRHALRASLHHVIKTMHHGVTHHHIWLWHMISTTGHVLSRVAGVHGPALAVSSSKERMQSNYLIVRT